MWNYRIVQYANGTGFGLHEVYYNSEERECGMTEHPAGFAGDDPDDIRIALHMALEAAINQPVFSEPDVWAPRDS